MGITQVHYEAHDKTKKKMFIFQQSNKKASHLMAEEDFFYKKLQKEQKSWTFSIFSI